MITKYFVPSASRSKLHTVTINHAGGAQHCTCEAWQYYGKCKHGTAVEADPTKFDKVDTVNSIVDMENPS